jgi:hypothetical protein
MLMLRLFSSMPLIPMWELVPDGLLINPLRIV